MATFSKFEEIGAWKKARQLTKEIYHTTRKGKFERDFSLRDQICRASTSIMSNIAEGFERSGGGEFLQFLSIAKGSAGEVRSILYVSLDQDYIHSSEFENLYNQTVEISSMLSGLISYLRKSNLKGPKYKKDEL